MYKNSGGTLYNLNYALASSVSVDPIEKKPLFHFYPDTLAFSIGSWGCNFHCTGCQNWQISCADIPPSGRGSEEILPARAVELAQRNNSQGSPGRITSPR
jgi:pyruvate formate lyase activating enzyme